MSVTFPRAFPNLLLLVGAGLVALGFWGRMEYNDNQVAFISASIGICLIVLAVCLWIWAKMEYFEHLSRQF